jgi:hypothetical protein
VAATLEAIDCTIVLMLYIILWVLALVVFVDGPEENSVRFSTESYPSPDEDAGRGGNR